MSVHALVARRGPSGFGYGSTAVEVTAGLELTGKTILLTGANSGQVHAEPAFPDTAG